MANKQIKTNGWKTSFPGFFNFAPPRFTKKKTNPKTKLLPRENKKRKGSARIWEKGLSYQPIPDSIVLIPLREKRLGTLPSPGPFREKESVNQTKPDIGPVLPILNQSEWKNTGKLLLAFYLGKGTIVGKEKKTKLLKHFVRRLTFWVLICQEVLEEGEMIPFNQPKY